VGSPFFPANVQPPGFRATLHTERSLCGHSHLFLLSLHQKQSVPAAEMHSYLTVVIIGMLRDMKTTAQHLGPIHYV